MLKKMSLSIIGLSILGSSAFSADYTNYQNVSTPCNDYASCKSFINDKIEELKKNYNKQIDEANADASKIQSHTENFINDAFKKRQEIYEDFYRENIENLPKFIRDNFPAPSESGILSAGEPSAIAVKSLGAAGYDKYYKTDSYKAYYNNANKQISLGKDISNNIRNIFSGNIVTTSGGIDEQLNKIKSNFEEIAKLKMINQTPVQSGEVLSGGIGGYDFNTKITIGGIYSANGIANAMRKTAKYDMVTDPKVLSKKYAEIQTGIYSNTIAFVTLIAQAQDFIEKYIQIIDTYSSDAACETSANNLQNVLNYLDKESIEELQKKGIDALGIHFLLKFNDILPAIENSNIIPEGTKSYIKYVSDFSTLLDMYHNPENTPADICNVNSLSNIKNNKYAPVIKKVVDNIYNYAKDKGQTVTKDQIYHALIHVTSSMLYAQLKGFQNQEHGFDPSLKPHGPSSNYSTGFNA